MVAATLASFEVRLPRPVAEDEGIFLKVDVGILPEGSVLVLSSEADGEIIGSAYPYQLVPGQDGGVHTIPVGEEMLKDGVLRVRAELTHFSKDWNRAVRAGEVEHVELVILPVSR